ncbi:MAG: hypothetical protein ACK4VV_04365 [Pseudomonas sp.]
MPPWSPWHPLQLFLGLIIWCLWFVVLYGGLSVGCEFAAPDVARGALTWINASSLVLAVLLALLLLWCARRCWRAAPEADQGASSRRFVSRIAAAVYLISACATVAVALPAVIFAPCI